MKNEPLEPRELEDAWRRATDADIRNVLRDLDGFQSQVVDIIQAEARRRGMDISAHGEPKNTRKTNPGMQRFLGRLRKRPLWLCVAMGVAFCIVTTLASQTALASSAASWIPFYYGLLIIADIVLGWPLRSYKRAMWTSFAFCLPPLVWFWFWFFVLLTSTSWIQQVVLYALLSLAVNWLVPFGLLAAIVWLRNTYQPVYPEGCCRRCGYDLTGLPLPRCPECGAGFATE